MMGRVRGHALWLLMYWVDAAKQCRKKFEKKQGKIEWKRVGDRMGEKCSEVGEGLEWFCIHKYLQPSWGVLIVLQTNIDNSQCWRTIGPQTWREMLVNGASYIIFKCLMTKEHATEMQRMHIYGWPSLPNELQSHSIVRIWATAGNKPIQSQGHTK